MYIYVKGKNTFYKQKNEAEPFQMLKHF